MSKQKLYCYVDESFHGERGETVIVAVVILGLERDEALSICERIEQETGKGKRKWVRNRPNRREAYIRAIFKEVLFKGKAFVAIHRDSQEHVTPTVESIAWAIKNYTSSPHRATVFIDALPQSLQVEVSLQLRQRGVQTKKVRGVRKEENDALTRLADALCGLVRAVEEKDQTMQELYDKARRDGFLMTK